MIDTQTVALDEIGFTVPNLTVLTLDNSKIRSCRDFGTHWEKLRVLSAANCDIQDLEGLGALRALVELGVSCNKIEYLTALVLHENLEVRNYAHQPISEHVSVSMCGTIDLDH